MRVFFKTYSANVAVARCNKICKDARPYLKVEIGGVIFSGLLDSGSTISIIGGPAVKFFSDFAEVHEPDDIRSVVTANGSTSPVTGYMYLPVTVDDVSRVVKFFVIPGVSSSLLFGINFWKTFNIAPDVLSLADPNNRIFFQNPADAVVCQVNRLHPFDTLTNEQKKLADNVYKMFEEISSDKKGLGRTQLASHHIETGDAAPIKQRYYVMSPDKLAELNRQLDEMLKMDVVEPSCSPWNNPVTMAPKANGEVRFCLDSRKLNQVSKHDAYPLPYINNILDQLRDARFLSSIDLKAAFWQIPLTPSSKEKTAFTVPSRGLFQFKVMCFGLTSAPATQQRLMDRLFGPEFNGRVFIYLDDIVVVSKTFEEHIELLSKVVDRLRSANLTVSLPKCCFFRRQLKYLGYVVDELGLRTDPTKITAITNFPVPTCSKDVKRFLGTASYYRRFIRGFSTIAAPLNALTSTRKNRPPFIWSQEAETAFLELKSALTSAPVLACPDFSLPFSVHTDASEVGVGGMLTQNFDGEEHPVAYYSRSLNQQERNYSATEKEALAVVNVVEHFRPYLEGHKPFTIITDHASLKWFLHLKNPTGRLERWGCRLSPYNFIIEHRRGSENIVPDALSRSVPITAINVVNDPWFSNIYSRCIDRPQTCPNFQIIDGKLYRYTKGKSSLTGDFDWKEVIPYDDRQSHISECHDSPLGAHLGVEKTYKRLRLRFYWPGLYQDVVDYVSKCSTCKAYKHPNQPTPGLFGNPKVCRRPFQCISVDLVGPLPKSRQQNEYLLVVVCCFSKYCLLFPLRRATSKVVAQRLEEHVFLVHGVPQTVIADNGPQFIGREIKDLFAKYSIPQIHYTPNYCPQVNTVERYNRTIVTSIAALVGTDQRTWDNNLCQIQFAMNTAVSSATSFTPFLIVHGREAVVNGTIYGDPEDLDEVVAGSRSEYTTKLGFLKDVFRTVDLALKKAHSRNAKYYNRHRIDTEFDVDDVVWRRTHIRSDAAKHFSYKLAPRFEKCKVVQKLSKLVYLLEDENGRRSQCHVKDIKGSDNSSACLKTAAAKTADDRRPSSDVMSYPLCEYVIDAKVLIRP